MKLSMYSIFDNKSQAFLQPFFQHNHAVAIRSVTQAVNDKSTDFSKWPSDFNLFCIGSFEDSNGDVVSVSPIENLGLLSNFIQE
jgi:hypothetical protein